MDYIEYRVPRWRVPRWRVPRWRVGLVCFVLSSLIIGESSFSSAGEPRFTRHVVPLFSKLGCNSGSCHGMVQGKGGFRLSLFGADPQLDYERLLREYAGRRVNAINPDASLILCKATSKVAHEGGKRLDENSPDYELLRRWIAAGATLDRFEDSLVQQLTVTPSVRTAKVGANFALQVQADFADGSREDVTALCAFEVIKSEVAEVDAQGAVRTTGIGDTTLVVRYPGQVAWCTLIVTPDKPTVDFPAVAEHNFIDKHILARLRLLNISPTDVCDDATFLRRVTLDVTGTLPAPDEVRAFLADKSTDKRAAKIDELLERPGYAALWATRFMDNLRVTGFSPATFPPVVQDEFRAYTWLRARLQQNIAYDELVERILTATSREGRGYDQWAQEVAAVMREEEEKKLPAAYAARQTLDLFWQRRMGTDVDHAIRVGHAFLGLRLQCAQCHRHPHDVWTQDDLLSFSNFFMRVPHFSGLGNPRSKPSEEVVALRKSNQAAAGLPAKTKAAFEKTFGERELYLLTAEHIAGDGMKGGRSYFNTSKDGFATVTSPLGTQSSSTLRLLVEKEPLAPDEAIGDRRTLVMAWLRRPDNPFFAKAIVNRVWAHYFDRGIIDPPDDLSPLNPPSHPELLQELCDGFIQNKYDLKWLHRTILNSRTYQQSNLTTEDNRHDRRNFASFYVRRMPAEVLLDIVDQATGVKTDYTKFRESRGAMPAALSMLDGAAIFLRGDGDGSFALTTFGRPERDVEVVCDCERDNQATMLQALFLANHPQVRAKISNQDGRVAAVMKQFDRDEQRIAETFLCTVNRPPTDDELQLCQTYLQQSASPQKGLEDLMLSLLSSNEFLFNH
jgi:hypothetical protein